MNSSEIWPTEHAVITVRVVDGGQVFLHHREDGDMANRTRCDNNSAGKHLISYKTVHLQQQQKSELSLIHFF